MDELKKIKQNIWIFGGKNKLVVKGEKIPIHTDELDSTGVSVEFVNTDQVEVYLLKAHRDDHYIFFLQQKGNMEVMIDFRNITLNDTNLLLIKPGQVHHYLSQKIVGWFLAVNPGVIEKDLRNYLATVVSPSLLINETHKLTAILHLLKSTFHSSEPNNFEAKEIQSYVNAFVAIVCSGFNAAKEKNKNPQGRSNQIVASFKELLKENFSTLKKPADFAKLLHISPSYLNETLVKTTGFSTSYWIQQELFLEAKRLLYYTELTSKEIAFELGFEDHTYFARLFKKVNKLTPIAFRKAYRNLSN